MGQYSFPTKIDVLPTITLWLIKKNLSYSPSRGEPVPLYKPPEDIAHQQNTAISRPDRESTAVCIDSAPSTGISTGISTESGHSDDHE